MKAKLNNLIDKYERENESIRAAIRRGPVPSERLGRLTTIKEIIEALHSLRS